MQVVWITIIIFLIIVTVKIPSLPWSCQMADAKSSGTMRSKSTVVLTSTPIIQVVPAPFAAVVCVCWVHGTPGLWRRSHRAHPRRERASLMAHSLGPHTLIWLFIWCPYQYFIRDDESNNAGNNNNNRLGQTHCRLLCCPRGQRKSLVYFLESLPRFMAAVWWSSACSSRGLSLVCGWLAGIYTRVTPHCGICWLVRGTGHLWTNLVKPSLPPCIVWELQRS